ncbi:MAG: ABC transporter permease [Bryobacteraceae bacterium]
MFANMVWFEIKLRSRQLSTYVYFALWFLMCFFSVASQGFGPAGIGKVLLNGPYAIHINYVVLTAFGSIILAAIFGTSILRDFKEDTYQLIFTKPISKLAYLGGRWAGSLIVSALIFSGLIFGMVFGSLAPWADHERIAAINLRWLLQPYFSVVLIQIFFLGSLFFMVAALTRRIAVVYLQGVILFALYMIASLIVNTGRSLDTFWPAVFDPLGLILNLHVTKYWTVAERNTQLVSWGGAFLYNRLLWIGAGVLALAITYAMFPMSVEALTKKGVGRRAARRKIQEDDESPVRHQGGMAIPVVTRAFGTRAQLTQLKSLTGSES